MGSPSEDAWAAQVLLRSTSEDAWAAQVLLRSTSEFPRAPGLPGARANAIGCTPARSGPPDNHGGHDVRLPGDENVRCPLKPRSARCTMLLFLGAALGGGCAASPSPTPGPAPVSTPAPASTPSGPAPPPPVPPDPPSAAAPSPESGAAPQPGAAGSQATPEEALPRPPTEEEKAAANAPPCTYRSTVRIESLTIEVRDASTDKPLCDATTTLRSAQGKEVPMQPRPYGDCRSAWVVDAAGKYTLRVSHPGYSPHTRTVLIERKDCRFLAPGFLLPLKPLKQAPPAKADGR